MAKIRHSGLALLIALGGCQAPLTTTILRGVNAQITVPGNTALGGACSGQDENQGIHLSGRSLLLVRANVEDVSTGVAAPWTLALAPANTGISQVTHASFNTASGESRCVGTSLRTVVLRERGVMYLDYVLEIADPAGGPATDSVSPWVVRGRAAVNETTGTANSRVGFVAFGRTFALHITAQPGPIWQEDELRRLAKIDEANHPTPQFGSPLPDELPGRTLSDVTRTNTIR